jgi:hypothetical protein
MSSHIGHDHQLRNHFSIVGIDAQGQSVTIQYDDNEWLRGQDPVQRLGWVEFLEGMVAGRFEVRRTD